MKTMWMVGLGSALGGMTRYGCALWMVRMYGEAFPWATLFVNVSGSFVIGLFFTLTAVGGLLPVHPDWRIFVTVGLCGGYTTFSSFSLQTLALARDGRWTLVAGNVLGSLVLCFVAVWLGTACATLLNQRS